MRELQDAARDGNVDLILQAVADNPDLLDDLSLESNENLVHIASKHGRHTVVNELLTLKPSLAQETNKSGYYSIHLAAAQGYEKVVLEHLKVDQDLCIRKDQVKGWTPLHWATIKGRTSVIALLLRESPDSFKSLTGRSQSCLHLAIEYNRCPAFKMLMSHLELLSYEELERMINLKDSKGLAILHRITLQNQYQTLDMLLSSTVISKALQINITDAHGCTPLDLFYVYSNEPDKEIGEMLHGAGAVRAGTQRRPLSNYGSMPNLPSGQGIFSGFFRTMSNIPAEKLASPVQLIAALLVAALQAVNNPFDSSDTGGETHGYFDFRDVLRGSGQHSQMFYKMVMNSAIFMGSAILIQLLLFNLPLYIPFFLLFLLLSAMIYYLLTMKRTLPLFIVICGPVHVPSFWFVWIGVFAYGSIAIFVVYLVWLIRLKMARARSKKAAIRLLQGI